MQLDRREVTVDREQADTGERNGNQDGPAPQRREIADVREIPVHEEWPFHVRRLPALRFSRHVRRVRTSYHRTPTERSGVDTCVTMVPGDDDSRISEVRLIGEIDVFA